MAKTAHKVIDKVIRCTRSSARLLGAPDLHGIGRACALKIFSRSAILSRLVDNNSTNMHPENWFWGDCTPCTPRIWLEEIAPQKKIIVHPGCTFLVVAPRAPRNFDCAPGSSSGDLPSFPEWDIPRMLNWKGLVLRYFEWDPNDKIFMLPGFYRR